MKKKSGKKSLHHEPGGSGRAKLRVAVLPSDLVKHYGDPSHPESRSFATVVGDAEDKAKWLLGLVNEGDRMAAQTLVEVAIFLASCVELLVQHNPDLARQIAERRAEWPILITQNPKYPVDPDSLRKMLNLEARSPRPFRVNAVDVLENPSIPHKLVYNALVALDEMRQMFQSMKKIQFFTPVSTSKVTVIPIKGDKHVSAETAAHFIDRLLKEATEKYEAAEQGALAALRRLDEALQVAYDAPAPDIETLLKRSASLEVRNAANSDAWFDAVCHVVLVACGGKHGNNQVIATLGASGKPKFKKWLLKTHSEEDVAEILRSGSMKDSEDHWVWEQVQRKLRTAFNAMSPDFGTT